MDNTKIFSNMIWRFLERTGAQCVTLVVSIILARLLDPSVYGTVSLVTVFTTILQVFVDSGLGNALIQKKVVDEVDYSTVFYFNMCICIILYVLLYFLAPYIANFYCMDELTSIIRVIGITFIVSGFKNIQQAYISKHMLFKKFFYSTIGGTLASGVIGIALAYLGYGVWALVFQTLSNLVIDTLVLWITVKWRPILVFSIDKLKVLFSYGWKLLVASLMDNIYNNIRQLIIGKMYSSNDLAHYNRGKQFPYLIATNINLSIDSVLFPTLSTVQDNIMALKQMTRRSIKMGVYIMAPLLIGLAVCGENIIKLLLTDKWLPCLPFMQIFCITYIFQPIQTANQNAIKALGRSDLFLKLNTLQRLTGLTLLFISMWYGVMAMAYSLLINNIMCQIIISLPNKKLLKYSYIEQIKDIFPSLVLTFLMGIFIYQINTFNISVFTKLVFQIGIGMFFYIIGSIIFKIDSFKYLIELVRKMILRR